MRFSFLSIRVARRVAEAVRLSQFGRGEILTNSAASDARHSGRSKKSTPSRARVRPLFLACLSLSVLRPFSLLRAVPPLVYHGPTEVAPTADGALPPVVGVHNIQVYRANRTVPTHADGLAHTYVHAPMLCHWRGHFYLQYLSGPRFEHEAPCVTSITRSVDGITWEAPRVAFPGFTLPDGSQTIAHQRMGFYVAPDGRLLTLGFYGKHPSPNDGTGIGRAVREVREDGSFGPLYFIRLNSHRAFPNFNPPFPLYTTSPDAGFVAACEALLADKLMTAQWWEEEQLDESGFYRVRGKALSFVTRPDGSHLGIWKNRLVATTTDRGATWTEKVFAANLPNNASKYWLQRTADGRYALVFNPTGRNRYPLAVTTSDDSAAFHGLATIHAELPDQRFGGYLKNMGPQYVRGIVEGNGTPPDDARAFWLTYSVNKEDIWVARVPVPVSTVVSGAVNDTFDSAAPGTLPEQWNIYSPAWAPVRVVDVGASLDDVRRSGSREAFAAPPPSETLTRSATKPARSEPFAHALELRDEDPYDYARAVRVFPATHGVKVSFRIFARQTNARLEIDLLDATGLRPVRLAFGEDGHLWACHEAQWLDAGRYEAGRWITFDLEIPANADADRCTVLVDGKSPLPRPAFFTDPVKNVHRLSFRTGAHRERGFGGRDLPGADAKVPAASFLIDDVVITPVSSP